MITSRSCGLRPARVRISRQRCLGRSAIACLLSVLAQGLNAQSPTGTIQGRVQDQAGAPIGEAQLHIVGTAFGALTDPSGHYFINNVPAGPATVRAVFVGYRPVEVRDFRVLAGQTATLDFTLESSPLKLQDLEVVVADNPLVPRDEVTTKQRVQGDFLERLPVDRVTDLLVLQPGVVSGGGRGPLALSIRGGRPDEVAVYLDGVPVTPGYRGLGLATRSTQLSVGTNAVEEASIITGSPSAEFGNAQSGVVSLVTRTGGTRYTGALSYETDEPFGVRHGLGLNRLEASLGGPIARNLTFFAAGVLEGQRSAGAGRDSEQAPIFVSAGLDTVVAVPVDTTPTSDTNHVPVYRLAVYRGSCAAFRQSANPGIRQNYGLPCQGIRIPYSPRSTYELQGKLTYSFGAGSRVGLSYLRSQTQERGKAFDGTFDYANLYNPLSLAGSREWSDVLTLNWTPNLTRSAKQALALEVYLSYQQDRSISGPLALQSELATRDPFGGYLIRPLGFLFDFATFPLDDELVENIRLNRHATRRAPYDVENPVQYNLVDQFRNDAYGLRGWNEGGGPNGRLRLFRESRYVGKVNFDWQLDRYNRLRAGGEATRYSVGRFESELATLGDAYLEHPERWNLFAENRLDIGDVVLIAGLRYDRYSSRARRPFLLDTVASESDVRPIPQHHRRLDLRGGRSVRRPAAGHLSAGPESRVPEPAPPGLVSGHRPDQRAILVCPPGTAPGLRGDAGRRQPRRPRRRPGFRPDHQLRVRRAPCLQRRHGARRGSVQPRQSRPRLGPHLPGRRSRTAAQERSRPGHQRRFRDHAWCGCAARPPFRQLVQRHHRLHVSERQEHRLGPAGDPGQGRCGRDRARRHR